MKNIKFLDIDKLIENWFEAAVLDDDEFMHKLIEAGCEIDFVDPETQKTALMHAIENYSHEAIDLLIQSGADVNFIVNGEHLLSFVIESDINDTVKLEIVKDLVNCGADVDYRDSKCLTLLDKENIMSKEIYDVLLKASKREFHLFENNPKEDDPCCSKCERVFNKSNFTMFIENKGEFIDKYKEQQLNKKIEDTELGDSSKIYELNGEHCPNCGNDLLTQKGIVPPIITYRQLKAIKNALEV